MFQNNSLGISDALSIGQQGFKENFWEEDNVWENRGGGDGGRTMEAKLLARASSGKDNCLLLINFLFVTIICCVRHQQIEEESVIMMDAFLSLVDVTC